MKAHIVLTLVVLLLASFPPAQAGISLGKGGITIPAGQTQDMCDVWIYATQEGGQYHVETTGGLAPLTSGISPNDFALSPIDCPQETAARRACITEKCLSSDQSSCKLVCVKFSAPLVFSWTGEKQIFEGSILDSIKIGAATIKEPYSFSVHVETIDVKPVVMAAAVLAVAAAAAAAFFAMRAKKRRGKK